MEINFENISHAILITESRNSYLSIFLEKYFKSIVCTSKVNNQACGVCENCNKIKNKFYYDIILIDGGKETISKEKIIDIQNKFLHMGLESGNKKIYVIKQIEKSSNQAVNSLLKFLEDPPNNTYAVLTTRNELLIPQTITSRCQRILLRKYNFDWSKIAAQYNLKQNDIKVLNEIYWTIDDVLEALENNSYFEISDLAKRFLIKQKPIEEINFLLEKFKLLSFKQIELILNYLLINVDINTKPSLLELLNFLKLNPIRSAMFWKIILATESNSNNEQ